MSHSHTQPISIPNLVDFLPSKMACKMIFYSMIFFSCNYLILILLSWFCKFIPFTSYLVCSLASNVFFLNKLKYIIQWNFFNERTKKFQTFFSRSFRRSNQIHLQQIHHMGPYINNATHFLRFLTPSFPLSPILQTV